jgi:tRNA (adenine22-N1)-methyltransferase
MIISDRLNNIANMVDRCNSMADIGTDHGYIPIFLVKSGVCQSAIASDINRGPVQKALKNIKLHGLQDKIECRLGGGLTTLKAGEVNIVVIAGMGGHLIQDILEESKDVVCALEALILQPVQHSEALRRYLYESGYNIVKEELCFDEGKYYEIIKTTYEGKSRVLEDIYYEISPLLLGEKHPLIKEYIHHKINKNNKIIETITETSEASEKRKEDLYNKNAKLKEMLLCL